MVMQNLDRTFIHGQEIPYVLDIQRVFCNVILQLGHMKYS